LQTRKSTAKVFTAIGLLLSWKVATPVLLLCKITATKDMTEIYQSHTVSQSLSKYQKAHITYPWLSKLLSSTISVMPLSYM